MDGFVRHAEALDEIDDAGHKPLGPAHVDVPAVQVGDELAQRALIDRGLLPVTDQRVQLPPAVTDQVGDLLAEDQVRRLTGPQQDDRRTFAGQVFQQRAQGGDPDPAATSTAPGRTCAWRVNAP